MRRTFLTAILVVFMAASLMMAFDGKGFAKMLDLDEKQTEKVQSIASDSEKEMIDLEAEMKKASMSFTEVMKKEDASTSEIEDSFKKLKATEEAMIMAQVGMMLDIREVLNDEQKAKYATHLYKAMSHTCMCSLGGGHGGGHGEGHSCSQGKEDSKAGEHKCSHGNEEKGEHKCSHGK